MAWRLIRDGLEAGAIVAHDLGTLLASEFYHCGLLLFDHEGSGREQIQPQALQETVDQFLEWSPGVDGWKVEAVIRRGSFGENRQQKKIDLSDAE